jgi:hypothetical protein
MKIIIMILFVILICTAVLARLHVIEFGLVKALWLLASVYLLACAADRLLR